jgi:hypothetical protein
MMKIGQQPAKEDVRKWLAERWQQRAPIPDADQIRRQLGWEAAAPTGTPPSSRPQSTR